MAPVNVVLCPLQIAVVPLMVNVGVAVTTTDAVVLAVQAPLAPVNV